VHRQCFALAVGSAVQVDTPTKKILLGVAIAYIGLVVILPFVNVFIQVRPDSTLFSAVAAGADGAEATLKDGSSSCYTAQLQHQEVQQQQQQLQPVQRWQSCTLRPRCTALLSWATQSTVLG
jgi:hypothetical protein